MKIISSKVFFGHNTNKASAEVPERLGELPEDWFRNEDLSGYTRYEHLLGYVHDDSYVEHIKRTCEGITNGIIPMSSDPEEGTFLCSNTYKVGCFAAGYAVDAVKESLTHEPTFAVVRPPGHHAERNVGKGFCIFNNMAIAVFYAVRELDKRVFIVDFDIHRGDGTQKMIEGEDRIYHVSINREGIYPDEFSHNQGPDNVRNIYLPPGASEDGHLDGILRELREKSGYFRPDVVGFSAGFDSCYLDNGWLEFSDFNMGKRYFESLRRFADELGVPYFAVLEGGYNPQSVLFGIKTFAGI